MKNVFIMLLLIICMPLVAVAANWETFFEARSQEGRVKVQVDTQSVRFSIVKGKKFVTFRLQSELENSLQLLKASGHYKASCLTDQAYKLESTLSVYKKNKLESQVATKTPEELKGKEYNDLLPIIKKLCQ